MDIEKFIQEMKGIKEKLNKNDDFSEKQKEILFDNLARKNLFEASSMPKEIFVNSPAIKKSFTQKEPDSFASLINRANVSQHMDYVIFAAYYLAMNENYENFNVKDINGEYKKAYIKSSNTNVFLVNLTKKGLLMPSGKKEGSIAFVVTRDGIKYVEELLQNAR